MTSDSLARKLNRTLGERKASGWSNERIVCGRRTRKFIFYCDGFSVALLHAGALERQLQAFWNMPVK
jgi:hypothetical protein